MTVFAVWADGSDKPAILTPNRAKAFAKAKTIAPRRRVAVYDDAGQVFSPTGRKTFCPECNRGDGHFPGPPHCRRIVETLV